MRPKQKIAPTHPVLRQIDVIMGDVPDFEESAPNRQPSALGKFFMGILANQPIGLSSGHLITAARQNPEFAEAVGKNKTFPYNVLRSLVDKGEIQKRENGLYYPILNPPVNNGPTLDVPQYIRDRAASQPAGHLDKYTAGLDEYK